MPQHDLIAALAAVPGIVASDPDSDASWWLGVTSPTRSEAPWMQVSVAAAAVSARVIEVDGSSWHAFTGVLDGLAAALEFPAYYGHNADAFAECLADVLAARGAASGIAVLVSNGRRVLSAGRDRRRFVDLVEDVMRDLGDDRAGFALVIDRRRRTANRAR